MRHLLVAAAFLLLLSLHTETRAQSVIDCSNCSQSAWGAEYNPATGGCAVNPTMGCGPGCNCHLGLMEIPTLKPGAAAATVRDFFGGAFVRNAKGVITGFRIDRPGPLVNNRVKPGDVAQTINGHRPRLSDLGTPKRPIRSAQAIWDSRGNLRLKLR